MQDAENAQQEGTKIANFLKKIRNRKERTDPGMEIVFKIWTLDGTKIIVQEARDEAHLRQMLIKNFKNSVLQLSEYLLEVNNYGKVENIFCTHF